MATKGDGVHAAYDRRRRIRPTMGNMRPAWSFPRLVENPGQDILGVRVVDQRLETALTPGVTSVNPRVRYYSLLVWGLYSFFEAHREGGKVEIDEKVYQRHLKRLNLAIVLGTLVGDPELRQVVGSRKLRGDLPDVDKTLSLDGLNRTRQPAQALPQYSSPMQEAELVFEKRGQLWLRSKGKRLAKVVARMPGMEVLGDVLRSGQIPAGVLAKQAKAWSLGAISRKTNDKERTALSDCLYGAQLPANGYPGDRDEQRSATAALILHLGTKDFEAMAAAVPAGWDRVQVATDLLMHDWHCLCEHVERDKAMSDNLRNTASSWRCLQARRVLHGVLEMIFQSTVEELPASTPKPRHQWIGECVADLLTKPLPWMKNVGLAGVKKNTKIADWLKPLDKADRHSLGVGIGYAETCDAPTTAKRVFAGVALIAWVWRLTRKENHRYCGEVAPPAVSLSAWGNLEDRWRRDEATVQVACAEVIDKWCLRQHRHNAIRKLRDDMECTLRFYEEEGSVWRSDLVTSADMSALRSRALARHLVELGLTNEDGETTKRGSAHLRRLLTGGA